MFITLAILCFAHFLCLAIALPQARVPSQGARTEYTINFDDTNALNQSAVSGGYTYNNWIAFDPSWQVARNGSRMPFRPHSSPNALILPEAYNSTTPEFSSTCSNKSFDMVSLWIAGCWRKTGPFPTTKACLVTFIGTKTNNSIVMWERPIRKTQMEIISFPLSRGFLDLKKFSMKTRFENATYTSSPAGEIALGSVIIASKGETAQC